ncbi:MAG: cation:proton antiporter [Gammaproteobacteria bacterium]
MELDKPILFAAIGMIALFSQWLAWRMKAPSIVFLLAAGILIGPVFGILNADSFLGDLLFPIVSISVAVVLFEGSLTLRFHELKDTGSALWRMLTIGVLSTWAVIACATHYLVGTSWELAILFGAIMVVTGPTVIGPMLRAVRPTEKIARLLRWEGIVIDPLGAVLAILVFDLILAHQGPGHSTSPIFTLGELLFVGILSGCFAGQLVGLALRKFWLPEYLHNVGTLLVVIAVFVLSDTIAHESGLLAVTIMGVWLANMPGVRTEEILDFKESLSVLLISGLFILLASRLQLDALAAIGLPALGVFLVTQFIARPLKVLVSTWPGELTWHERGLLAWIAPRGIVAAAISSLFALRLEEINYPGAENIVPLAFALIIGTVVWQGLTAPTVARWLGVAQPEPTGILFVGGNALARAIAAKLHDAGFRIVIADSGWDNIRAARMAGLPTYFGNPVSEHAERRLDLTGIGHVFAMSRRDTLNALACARFSAEFGRNAVHALAVRSEEAQSEKHVPAKDDHGALFGPEQDYATLARMLAEGAEIRQSKLKEEFNYAAMRKQNPGMIPLLAWDAGKRIQADATSIDFTPKAGWTVLILLPAGAEKPPAEKSGAEKSGAEKSGAEKSGAGKPGAEKPAADERRRKDRRRDERRGKDRG